MENPIYMEDLGVPIVEETRKEIHNRLVDP